ncbi:uncharacterized protein LTR77_005621 [Saxophila tyrrhenica]|uniref:FAD dependent oxidoreductase domain-containing protein n=1 Tax=Saxophila tyrrhenica TaxID=1690608 RepID=A0AAV9PCH3_9PEZI|nr:hypothetical protein LTR77_005621 [Saxophila tyrrhenica]
MATDGMPDASRMFSVFVDSVDSQSTVIIGAGIMGCATAYYLAKSGNTRPDTIHLIESSPELFTSASGKAAGFVAPDWFGPATAGLGELSFRLHSELAAQHNGRDKWGYSPSTGTSMMEGPQSMGGDSRARAAATHEYAGDKTGPAWLTRREGDRVETLSEHGGVAQVDPPRLSQFLLRESILKGVRLHNPAKALRVSTDHDGNLSAVRVEHQSGAQFKIPCTRLLITAGAWTPSVFQQLFPSSSLQIPVSQLAGHSLTVKSPRWSKEHESDGCDAVFTTMSSGFSPEIFSRIGGEIYIAGLNDPSLRLPDSATDAKIDQASIEELKKVAQRLLGQDGTDVSDLEVVREGLCFRPVTPHGAPILSRIADEDLGHGIETKPGADGGVFIAAGHGPWGISHSLGTGKVMAELIERQAPSADVSLLGM